MLAIGSGLGALAIRTVKRDSAPTAIALVATAGSFAAISTSIGSPMVAAFLMLEVAGIGAMSASMLKLPFTSVLLATVLLSSDAYAVMPLAIVAVVVADVETLRFPPPRSWPRGRSPVPALDS